MNSLKAIAAAVGVALALTACGPDPARMSNFVTLDAAKGWAYADTLRFGVERPDSMTHGRLDVALTHTSEYPFSNLWLEVAHTEGSSRVCDTLNIPLCDPYGRWLGQGFGTSYQVTATVDPDACPPNGSVITVRHIMRLDTLRGIDRIGVQIQNPPTH